eukprot:ANDGO_03706.mRNA.1 hypothetical protein
MSLEDSKLSTLTSLIDVLSSALRSEEDAFRSDADAIAKLDRDILASLQQYEDLESTMSVLSDSQKRIITGLDVLSKSQAEILDELGKLENSLFQRSNAAGSSTDLLGSFGGSGFAGADAATAGRDREQAFRVAEGVNEALEAAEEHVQSILENLKKKEPTRVFRVSTAAETTVEEGTGSVAAVVAMLDEQLRQLGDVQTLARELDEDAKRIRSRMPVS